MERTIEDRLKELDTPDIERIYRIGGALMLDGFATAQTAALHGDPRIPMAGESQHMRGGVFAIAPEAQLLRKYCTHDHEYDHPSIHDDDFPALLTDDIEKFPDNARCVVAGKLHIRGTLYPNIEWLERISAELTGIPNVCENSNHFFALMLPDIYHKSGEIGTKTKDALFFALCCHPVIALKRTVPYSNGITITDWIKYDDGKRIKGTVNPVETGEVVVFGPCGPVKKLSLEISTRYPAEYTVGYAIDAERKQRTDWPVVLKETRYHYDRESRQILRSRVEPVLPDQFNAIALNATSRK